METCIFCKIVKGEIPSKKIFENDSVVAFLDINPISKGHSLVIPKNHYVDIFEMPEHVLAEIIRAAKLLSKELMEKLEADGINLLQSNRPAANQIVPHFHLHIIPRYKGDGLLIVHGRRTSGKELDEVFERLKK